MHHKTNASSLCMTKGKTRQEGKELKTVWIGKGCPGEPGLCVDNDCFETYHTTFDSVVL